MSNQTVIGKNGIATITLTLDINDIRDSVEDSPAGQREMMSRIFHRGAQELTAAGYDVVKDTTKFDEEIAKKEAEIAEIEAKKATPPDVVIEK